MACQLVKDQAWELTTLWATVDNIDEDEDFKMLFHATICFTFGIQIKFENVNCIKSKRCAPARLCSLKGLELNLNWPPKDSFLISYFSFNLISFYHQGCPPKFIIVSVWSFLCWLFISHGSPFCLNKQCVKTKIASMTIFIILVLVPITTQVFILKKQREPRWML